MTAAVIYKFVLAFVVYRGMGLSKTVFPAQYLAASMCVTRGIRFYPVMAFSQRMVVEKHLTCGMLPIQYGGKNSRKYIRYGLCPYESGQTEGRL